MPQARNKKDEQGDTGAETVAESPKGFVEVLFDKGWELKDTYDTYLGQRKANRIALRSLADQGLLTDEQMAELGELYPARESHANGKAAEDATPAQEPAQTPTTAA